MILTTAKESEISLSQAMEYEGANNPVLMFIASFWPGDILSTYLANKTKRKYNRYLKGRENYLKYKSPMP